MKTGHLRELGALAGKDGKEGQKEGHQGFVVFCCVCMYFTWAVGLQTCQGSPETGRGLRQNHPLEGLRGRTPASSWLRAASGGCERFHSALHTGRQTLTAQSVLKDSRGLALYNPVIGTQQPPRPKLMSVRSIQEDSVPGSYWVIMRVTAVCLKTDIF